MSVDAKPIWTKTIPSEAGTTIKFSANLRALKMKKPTLGGVTSFRYYDLLSGRYLLASTITPVALDIGTPREKADTTRLIGIEVSGAFIQASEWGVSDAPENLINRITYSSPSGPISILGLRCKKKYDTGGYNFQRPQIKLPTNANKSVSLQVDYHSTFLGQEAKKTTLEIPIRNDRFDIATSKIPAQCRLVALDSEQNGEDLRYDSRKDRALLAQAKTLKTLRITSEENGIMLNELGRFENLETLEIACLEKIESLPTDLLKLTKLKNLTLNNGNGCEMNIALPENIGALHELRTLDLYGALDPRLSGQSRKPLPRSLANLRQLESLNLGRNGLKTIPPEVFSLSNLKNLNLSANEFTSLPDELARMPKLKQITLGENQAISCSKSAQATLKSRFKKIQFDFSNEYDCPDGSN